MDGDADALPGGVKAGDHAPRFIGEHPAAFVRGYPTHHVMARGGHGNGLRDRIDAEIDAAEGGDLPELLADLLLTQGGEVEVDVLFARDAAAGPDLHEDGPGDDVPGREVCI